MTYQETSIVLENLKFHAYHGVAEQETRVGNTFIINLKIGADIRKAIETDELSYTLNYAAIYETIKEEMLTPSLLLEHICGRIVKKLFERFALINSIEIKLSKQNPPMGADIDSAGVVLNCKR